jgi:hypothetical protein
MPAPPPQQQHRPLPPLAWAGIIGGVVLAFVLVALLAVQLAVLTDSRNHIRAQDAKISRLYDAGRPALREARPAVRALPALLRAAAPLLRDARSALRSVDGSGSDLTEAARAVPPLLRTADALATVALPLVIDLRAVPFGRVLGNADALIGALLYRGRLVHVLDGAGALVGALLDRGRLVRVLDDAESALDQIRSEDLIANASRSARLAPRAIYLARRLLRVQKVTLRVQRSSRGIQARTLRVQLRALAHIESIDRKTGGQLPPTPVGR